MGLAKRIGKSERLRGALCWLTSLYIRLLYATGRWTMVGAEIPAAFWDEGRPFILAFWHGRILMMNKIWRPSVPISMLISQHRDGLLIARTVAHFGIKTVAGSSTRGGTSALRTMLKLLKAGECIGITPDGPKGPRMRAAEGVAAIARLSGCPVIPAAWSVRHGRLLNSWDRFLLPRLFTEGVFLWGTPIEVAAGNNDPTAVEATRRLIEERLAALTAEADRAMGRTPVEAA